MMMKKTFATMIVPMAVPTCMNAARPFVNHESNPFDKRGSQYA